MTALPDPRPGPPSDPLPPGQDSAISDPRQRLLPNRRHFVLADPAVYTWRLHAADGDAPAGVYRLVVPEGFDHDFASVPRLLWALVAPFDLGLASIFHDWLYRRRGDVETLHWIEGAWTPIPLRWTRRNADRLFGRLMREQGVAGWKRDAAFLAVRWFARGLWGRPCQPEPAPPR